MILASNRAVSDERWTLKIKMLLRYQDTESL